MTEHNMNLNPTPFDMIKCGNKTIELRLLDSKRRCIEVGDTIKFTNTAENTEIITVRVLALHKFDSFETLYKSLPLLKCGYTEEDIGSASPSDMNEYYTMEEQNKYGVVGIEICLI